MLRFKDRSLTTTLLLIHYVLFPLFTRSLKCLLPDPFYVEVKHLSDDPGLKIDENRPAFHAIHIENMQSH